MSHYDSLREARRQCVQNAIMREEESTGAPLSPLDQTRKVTEWIKGEESFAACKTDQSRINAVRRVLRELQSGGRTPQLSGRQSLPDTAIIQPMTKTRLDDAVEAAKSLSLSEKFVLLERITHLVEAHVAAIQQEAAFNKIRLDDMYIEDRLLKERIRTLSNGTAHRPLVTERHMATPGN